MTEYQVREIMSADVPVLTRETPIRHAVAVLVDAGAAAAPVIGDDGRLIGILTQKDCFRPTLHASYHREWSGRVADHMSDGVVSVDIGEEIIRVAEMFLEHPHRVFPVRDGSGVAGLVERADVLAYLIHHG